MTTNSCTLLFGYLMAAQCPSAFELGRRWHVW